MECDEFFWPLFLIQYITFCLWTLSFNNRHVIGSLNFWFKCLSKVRKAGSSISPLKETTDDSSYNNNSSHVSNAHYIPDIISSTSDSQSRLFLTITLWNGYCYYLYFYFTDEEMEEYRGYLACLNS